MTNHAPVWVNVINSKVFDVAGETFIQPEIVPPFHCHQVTEPLPIKRSIVRSVLTVLTHNNIYTERSKKVVVQLQNKGEVAA